MNRVSKAIFIALGGLVAIVVLLLLGINLYVQSPGAQARIQEELSKTLKVPLVITSTSLTPWSDLQIHGITVPGTDPAGNFLEAAHFSAHHRWLPLLRKQLVIYDMLIESPKIVWVQNKEGAWVLPSLVKTAANPSEKHAEKPKSPPDKKGRFEVVLEAVRLTNGSIELLDQEQQRVALVTGLNMASTSLSTKSAEGTATIECILYSNAMLVENIHASLKYSEKEFTVPSLSGSLAGGVVSGDLALKLQKGSSPFVLNLQLDKVDLGRLSTEAGWTPGQAAGTLTGAVSLHGSSGNLPRAEGKGQLSLANAQFKQLDILQPLSELIQLEELANLRLKTAHADFHVADEKAFIDLLELEALNLRLSAQGLIRIDGKIALEAKLAFREALVKKLPSFFRSSLTETDSAGLPAVAFKVTGKTDHPKTDLVEKLVGKKYGDQFENLVTSLFGAKKKKDEDPKPKKKKNKDSKGESKPAAIEPGQEKDNVPEAKPGRASEGPLPGEAPESPAAKTSPDFSPPSQ